ncbi:hypothetical protein [Crocosphaera sp.]|uniref:hypothetical protein n=1 Tax=Crocosphaera sp. TaxID=2729996 RepID=UPI00261DAA81|nr:hypothetical protein [Crocosphaera sp.]MDJ0581208.1 hypothetical protein [Crocosphaera sp.]
MTSVNLSIPFEALVKAIKSLDLEQKQQVLEILEEQIFESEEKWENSPEIIAEVEEAKKAYQSGDYLTLEEFIAGQS